MTEMTETEMTVVAGPSSNEDAVVISPVLNEDAVVISPVIKTKNDKSYEPETGVNLAVTECLAALTVSFVAISLGAAFGAMSGRGALSGILSAGIIALVTSIFGGTRIQCSGPTGPMTAISSVLISQVYIDGIICDDEPTVAYDDDVSPFTNHCKLVNDQFINLVFVIMCIFLFIMAALRLGSLCTLVPKLVISGFMNGIAVIIWISELCKIFGLNGKPALSGPLVSNIFTVLATLVMVFKLGDVINMIVKKVEEKCSEKAFGYAKVAKKMLPTTLLTMLFMTIFVSIGEAIVGGDKIQRVSMGAKISSGSDISDMLVRNFPDFGVTIPEYWDNIGVALPFAANLAMLAYLDSLLTSLVVDKMVQEKFNSNEITNQNQELAAQGLANLISTIFGGIPGAQATIRSVLILNENASTRGAGILVGVLVILEMLLLQEAIALIPSAVFTGILIKVGSDVFAWVPILTYIRQLKEETQEISHVQMWVYIIGTTVVTATPQLGLNLAVGIFTIVYYVHRHHYKDFPDLFEMQPAKMERIGSVGDLGVSNMNLNDLDGDEMEDIVEPEVVELTPTFDSSARKGDKIKALILFFICVAFWAMDIASSS